MPAQTLDLSLNYTVDSGLILTAEEYLVNYLTDIPLRGLGGELLPDSVIEEKLRIATEQLESFLSIKIPRQRISEEQDFERDHFNSWGAIKLNYLISEVNELLGKLNFAQQIRYPRGWVSIKRQLDKARMLFLVPSQQTELESAAIDFVVTFSGRFPIFGYSSANYIPNYWQVDYTTGFDKVPRDLQDAISKFASMQILAILGDVTFGAGIASTSLSIDGLSQSVGTTQSAENSLYSARVRQFERELKNELKWLKNKYTGLPTIAL